MPPLSRTLPNPGTPTSQVTKLPQISEVDRILQHENDILRQVIEIIRHGEYTRGTGTGYSLRHELEKQIREALDFTKQYCKRCMSWLPAKQFTKDHTTFTGFRHICKNCARLARQESYYFDVERSREYARARGLGIGQRKTTRKPTRKELYGTKSKRVETCTGETTT